MLSAFSIIVRLAWDMLQWCGLLLRPRESFEMWWLRRHIAEGTFVFADDFPEFAAQHDSRIPVAAKNCSIVIDEFLRFLEAGSQRIE